MTRQQLLISLAGIMSATDFQSLAIAVTCYEQSVQVPELKGKAEAVFGVFKILIDEEFANSVRLSVARSDAGRMGAQKRWQDSKIASCHFAITPSAGESENRPTNAQDAENDGKIASCHFAITQENKETSPVPPIPPIPPNTPITPIRKQSNNAGAREIDIKHNSLEERKREFALSLKNYVGEGEGKYPREMVVDFYDYWIEPNRSKTKMKFELEKTWDISRRLRKWAEMDGNINSKQNGNIRKHISDIRTGSDELQSRDYGESTL